MGCVDAIPLQIASCASVDTSSHVERAGLLHPWIVRRVGVHGRATVIAGFGAEFVVPGPRAGSASRCNYPPRHRTLAQNGKAAGEARIHAGPSRRMDPFWSPAVATANKPSRREGLENPSLLVTGSRNGWSLLT